MSTYIPIQSITLTSDVASVDFTGIPQTFKDLVIVSNIANNGISSNMGVLRIQLGNGSIDTGNNYSSTLLVAETATPVSARTTNLSYINGGEVLGTIANRSTSITHIGNYSSSKLKTVLQKHGTTTRIEVNAGQWRNTAAINQVRLGFVSTSFISGSTFTLYGIDAGTLKAIGGEVTVTGGYAYHTFKQSGIFTANENLTADLLVVAGGGAGGNGGGIGGGGGAGGLLYQTGRSILAKDYIIQIGAGGPKADTGGNRQFVSASNSIFDNCIALGGGFGGDSIYVGNGGSGGGSGEASGTASGAGTATQGNSGGATGYGNNGGAYASGGLRLAGGGGAGGAGGIATSSAGDTTKGLGGVGLSIFGTFYAGGGGGAVYQSSTASSGGNGGGGAGGAHTGSSRSSFAVAGTANTGGGGGGEVLGSGAAGGSGIVIVRYAI